MMERLEEYHIQPRGGTVIQSGHFLKVKETSIQDQLNIAQILMKDGL